MTTAPRGFESGDRSSWLLLCHHTPGSGFNIQPLGFEILINHKSQNVSQWTLDKLFYNGKYYDTMEELEEQYKAGQLEYVTVPKLPPGEEMGSLRRRSGPTAAPPFQFERIGVRNSVKNNQVLFQSWSLAFGLNRNTGMRLFDIKFNGERIVYELSVQEAISIYGSNAPGGITTRYMEGHYGIGRFAFELVKGVDCFYVANYVDTHYFIYGAKSAKNKDSICIFEHNPVLPVRRHYSNFYSESYGGLPSKVLVIRTISTLGNYDYVFDFLFYQNGAIESRVHATGYISSSFYFANGVDYGNRVGEHFINYKADLEVANGSL